MWWKKKLRLLSLSEEYDMNFILSNTEPAKLKLFALNIKKVIVFCVLHKDLFLERKIYN